MVAKLDAWYSLLTNFPFATPFRYLAGARYFLILDKARTDDIINGLAELIRLPFCLSLKAMNARKELYLLTKRGVLLDVFQHQNVVKAKIQ